MPGGSAGIARLKDATIGIVRDHAPGPRRLLALGRIQTDLSLLVDGFPDAWVVGAYLVLEQALASAPLIPPFLATDSAGTPAHVHQIQPFSEYLPYAAGDRVLVVLLDDDVLPVVLGRTRPSKVLP